jgi:hypothetical protein
MGDMRMTGYEFWSLIIQGAVGVGTLLVAITAIWGDVIRSRWSGPKLRVSIHDAKGELNWLNDKRPARYYHMTVINDRRWSPAHNVRVLLTKVFQPAADGRWVDRSFSGPLQLSWQFPESHPMFPVMGPDRICDLGFIVKGERFRLSPYVVPNNFTGYVSSNEKILVEVVAVADNGESLPARVEITWDGEWSDEETEMSRHLVVKDST